MEYKRQCPSCKNKFVTQNIRKKFCSTRCYRKHHYHFSSSEAQYNTERTVLRRVLVHLKGGKCLHCGEAENYAALCFHHVDESSKKFELNMQAFSSKTYEEIIKELEKCILLCLNCHAKLHNPEFNMPYHITKTGSLAETEIPQEGAAFQIKYDLRTYFLSNPIDPTFLEMAQLQVNNKENTSSSKRLIQTLRKKVESVLGISAGLSLAEAEECVDNSRLPLLQYYKTTLVNL